MTQAIASIIIPAYNEANAIEGTLRSLTGGVEPGQLEIIVVCNGCRDDTAEVAAAAGRASGVRVVSIDEASKAAALNLGDDLASVFPRIYLDADVVVSGPAVLAVVRFLRDRNEALAARPPLHYVTDDCGRLVRAYYRARSRTPTLMHAIWGAGFYAVNEAGRASWGKFHDDQADDILVASHLGRGKVHIVGHSPAFVSPPRDLKALLKTLSRVHDPTRTRIEEVGSRAGGAKSPGWKPQPGATLRDMLTHNRHEPAELLDAVVYVLIAVAARARSTVTRPEAWERDDTTRQPA